jgi:hypothetical protein
VIARVCSAARARHTARVEEVQDRQRGAGLGGELRRKVVVRVDDAQAGEGEELSEGIN